MTPVSPALRHIYVEPEGLLDQSTEYLRAPTSGPYCDTRLDRSPFVCTREPHADETHVSHDAAGRPFAVWPLSGFALLRSAGVA